MHRIFAVKMTSSRSKPKQPITSRGRREIKQRETFYMIKSHRKKFKNKEIVARAPLNTCMILFEIG